VRLFRVLYDNSVSCVRTGGSHSSWFIIEAGIPHSAFETGMAAMAANKGFRSSSMTAPRVSPNDRKALTAGRILIPNLADS